VAGACTVRLSSVAECMNSLASCTLLFTAVEPLLPAGIDINTPSQQQLFTQRQMTCK
jgi:hypothetical protein